MEESKVLEAELESGNFSSSVLGKLNKIFKDYTGSTPEDSRRYEMFIKSSSVLEQNLAP